MFGLGQRSRRLLEQILVMPLDVFDRRRNIRTLWQAHTAARKVQQAAIRPAIRNRELLTHEDAAILVETEGASVEEPMMQGTQQDAVVDGAGPSLAVHPHVCCIQAYVLAEHDCAEVAERAAKLVRHGDDSLELWVPGSRGEPDMLSEANLGQDALMESLRKLAAQELTYQTISELMISERSCKARSQSADRMLA